jgi:gliding motility-associated-like protein
LDTTAGIIVGANPPTTTVYTVIGTSVAGCTATTTFTLTVNPLPVVTVNSGTICFGNSTPLQALGANTYAWSPASGLSSSSGSNVSASPTSTTTYVVTGTDVNNCKSTDTAVVVVHSLPSLVSSPPATSGCEPQCVDFSNTGISSGAYLWNFGDGKTSSSAAPNHCFSKGSYTVTVTLTDSNGCVNKSSSMVTAFPTPKANFNVDPQPTTILEPIIHFTDATTGGAWITSWNWDFGDGVGTSTIQNPIYTYLDTGTFAAQLVVTSNLGCMDSITINVIINDEYFIYVPSAFTPNFDGTNDAFLPVGEGVTEYKLWVYDRWGNLAFSSNDILKGWDGRHLNKGNTISQEDVYIWKIEAKNKKGEPKLLKGIVNLIK